MTNVVWDVKSIRGMFRQLLGDAAWGLAVNGEPTITVMVIEVPAEALLAHFKAQVIASGYSVRLGKTFHNCDKASPPLGGDLPGYFERHLIHSFVHLHTHPLLEPGLVPCTCSKMRCAVFSGPQ